MKSLKRRDAAVNDKLYLFFDWVIVINYSIKYRYLFPEFHTVSPDVFP